MVDGMDSMWRNSKLVHPPRRWRRREPCSKQCEEAQSTPCARLGSRKHDSRVSFGGEVVGE